MEPDNVKNPLWLSSIDPTKLSMTIKGILNGFLPLVAIAIGFVDIDLTATDFQQFTDSIPALIASVWGAVAALQITYGALRKIIVGVAKMFN